MSEIAKWYKEKNIFITGGLGFMGKVLIEKLLRSCPDIGGIYILCRSKRDKSPSDRLRDAVHNLKIFERLRNENIKSFEKLYAVEGNLTQDGLGISDESVKKNLMDNINVVFNIAASLKLEAGLKFAVEHNVKGTLRVLEFCKTLNNLEIFIHTSTAFCHGDHEILEEKLYPFNWNSSDLFELITNLEDAEIDRIEKKTIEPHPNCYTFTKRMSEILVNDFKKYYPVVIIRPSIVTPAHSEPVPGWVDSLNGPMGVFACGAKGVLRSMMVDGETQAEIIPVDIAINAIIVAASKSPKSKGDLSVYNVSCGKSLKNNWKNIIDSGIDKLYKNPITPALWYPSGSFTNNRLKHKVIVFLFQILPAIFIDFLLTIFFQKRWYL